MINLDRRPSRLSSGAFTKESTSEYFKSPLRLSTKVFILEGLIFAPSSAFTLALADAPTSPKTSSAIEFSISLLAELKA